MKRVLFTTLFLLSFFFSPLQAKEPARKILILTGGHDFDVKEFYEIFDAMPGVVYEKAELPRDMNLLTPGLEEKYDTVVSYDMNRFEITDEQRENFDRLMLSGMPLLVFHHSIGGYSGWQKYVEIAGGQYVFKETEIDGEIRPKSDFKHDVEMEIVVADRDHPITQGVDDFEILDEAYKNVYVRPGVHVLLTTENPHATREVAWVHRYGNSPVFTIMLGHDRHAYANENLRKLLAQGIEWLVSEKEK